MAGRRRCTIAQWASPGGCEIIIGSMNTTLRRLGLSARGSPAPMSWGRPGVRVVGFVLVLPLVLRHLPAEETAVWFLFLSLIALQGLADFGFAPTFVRAVAYARAGPEAGAERLAAGG